MIKFAPSFLSFWLDVCLLLSIYLSIYQLGYSFSLYRLHLPRCIHIYSLSLSFSLSIYLSIYLSDELQLLFIPLTFTKVHTHILSLSLSFSLSLSLSIYLSIYQMNYSFSLYHLHLPRCIRTVCLSVCLSVSLSAEKSPKILRLFNCPKRKRKF